MSSDQDMITTRYHYSFIHNVIGHFFKDSLEYFGDYLYPRFQYQVMGTYDKAVEYLSKKEQYSREVNKPLLPALILNPSGDMGLAEASSGAKQLFRFPNLAPGLLKRVYEPVYQDQHVQVYPGFMRLKGEIELIMLFDSFYEYFDVRLYLLQMFGGTDRYIYPQYFNSFIILGSDLYNYRYTNDVTGVSYKLDWESAGSYETLVRSTNKEEKVIPCTIKPIFKLTGLGDGSTKYGGTALAEWKLTASIEYEIEVASYLVLETDYLAENIQFEIKYGSCYSTYNYDIPVNRTLINYHWDFGLDATSSDILTDLEVLDTTSSESYIGDFEFKNRYMHIITQSEIDTGIDIDIDLPEQITNYRLIIVNSRFGEMSYWTHYKIVNSGWTLRLLVDNIENLVAGQCIELFVYEEI